MQRIAAIVSLLAISGCSETTAPPPPPAPATPPSPAVSAANTARTPSGVPTDSESGIVIGDGEKLVAGRSADWRQWRGPNRNGVAEAGQSPPTSWSESENIVWKTPVPGRGHSSPTVVGDRIFLQTADERQQVQSVVAFDRNTGDQLWKTDVARGGFPPTHKKNTHASATIACNGKRLFAAFAHHDAVHLYALDLNGKEVWKQNLGTFTPQRFKYGYAPSPTLYGGTVIVAADTDAGGFITARDQKNGAEIWKTQRPAKLSFSSPIVTTIAGKDQLLISGCESVSSFNPSNGQEIWSVAATTMATCGTVVWDGGMVFASGGYPKAETVGLRADTGQVVWRNGQKCYEQSMVADNGYLYAVTDRGIAYCWDARSGEEKWRGRLSSPISSSPVLAGGNIYLANEAGQISVFRATPDAFELVSQIQLGTEAFATPAICGGRIYLRVADSSGGGRQEFLYCIGS